MPKFLITITITGKFEIPTCTNQRNTALLSQLLEHLEMGTVHLVEAFQTDVIPFENFKNIADSRLSDSCQLSMVCEVSKSEVLSEKSHYYSYVSRKLQELPCTIDKVWDIEGSIGIGIKSDGIT
jgi:hypothetical protein